MATLKSHYLNMIAGLLAIVLVGCTATAAAVNDGGATVLPSGGIVIDPPRPVTDAVLTDQSGKLTHLTDLRGKVSLVFFGYTKCPDVCPVVVSDWTRVKKAIGTAADKTNFVFISVDPARDTPDTLTTYLGAFDKTFTGLTAAVPTIKKIGDNFGAIFAAPDQGGVIGHSTSAYLVDSNLQVRVEYPVGTKPPAIATDIQNLIANGGK